ncbi:MAG: BlaI/MecI/CopY family transcriptional regulator [Clostridiales bacterium]|nr:BlaI/MecI/CopY family transcriptional regulator [Clostridiales bacterium]
MEKISLSDGEWKLMNLLWDESPLVIAKIVNALKHDTGWSRATVNIMLTRLSEKGAVRIENLGRQKFFYPILGREQAVCEEARSTLEKIKTKGIGLLLGTMTSEAELTDEEVEELYRILKERSKK